MSHDQPPYNDESQVATTVGTCPQCGGAFETRESGEVQAHHCQVCGLAWTEVMIYKVKELGVGRYVGRAKREHPNLDIYAIRRLMKLRALIGNVGRQIPPIHCANRGCRGLLKNIEPLLAQLLSGGWPTTGGAPILCIDCAKQRTAQAAGEKHNPLLS